MFANDTNSRRIWRQAGDKRIEISDSGTGFDIGMNSQRLSGARAKEAAAEYHGSG